jgi:hypothetical protein
VSQFGLVDKHCGTLGASIYVLCIGEYVPDLQKERRVGEREGGEVRRGGGRT